MQIDFTAELEDKIAESAARQGCTPAELVLQIVERYLEDDSRFADAVTRGEEALLRGEYLMHEQVGQRLGRSLRR